MQPWTDSSPFEVFLNSHCAKPSSFPYAKKKWIENHNFSQSLWSQEKTHRTLRPPAKSFNWVPLLLVPRISVALLLPLLCASSLEESKEDVWAHNSLWRQEEIVTGTCGWVEVPFETEVENLCCALNQGWKERGESIPHGGSQCYLHCSFSVLRSTTIKART